MSPIQQMLLGVGAVATKTYVDDIFSTFLYAGNDSTQSINNGIDLSAEGGLVWIKERDGTYSHNFYDTERGVGRSIYSNLNIAEEGPVSNTLTSFNSNGFSLGDHQTINDASNTYASWTLRKAPGFFTIKEYTGSGSTQSLTHDLGSVPGMIMVKRTDYVAAWAVYHRQANGGVDPEDYTAELNTSGAFYNDTMWGDTKPTSTHFTVGDAKSETNASGGTYIAYIFAGGESTNALARSVDFDGSDDYIRTPDHSDLDLDTNQFTIEMWVKSSTNPSSGNMNLVGQWGGNDRGYAVRYSLADQSFNGWGFQYCTNEQGSDVNTINGSTGIDDGQWHHLAVVRESSTIKLYTDGILSSSTSISGSLHITNSERDFYVGSDDSDNRYTGNVSNVRVVVGTALYTSLFKPPTEPLTNVTNTKLLCCNNSSVTGSTVSPGTIYSGGGPTASSDSPFEDPAGYVFGDAGDQNVIKCGSYVGNGSSGLGPVINLGFEPQWILLKCSSESENWRLYDSMRGVVTGGNDAYLIPDRNWSENSIQEGIELTSTGFKLKSTDGALNGNGRDYIYCCIRRSDGYVGKPPELGTDVFSLVAGRNSPEPTLLTNFVTDFGFFKHPTATEDWFGSARLMQGKFLRMNTTDAEASTTSRNFDYNDGWSSGGLASYQGWSWKRGAGFDVVCYKGNGTSNHQIRHSLNKTPEMMWVRQREATNDGTWFVWHKGLNNGNPGTHFVKLNTNDAESDYDLFYGDPTSTSFSLYSYDGINGNNENHIAMLFASVSGISKVGYYTGDGTSNGSHEIPLGFTPRFLIIKCVTSGVNFSQWNLWDSLRGLDGSGSECYLKLNSDGAEVCDYDYLDTTSTGFKLNSNYGPVNGNGNKMIYYAHA